MNTKKSEVKGTKTTTKANSKVKSLRFLEAVLGDIKDKNLSERINYTLNAAKKDIKKVLQSDLIPLVEEAKGYLSADIAPVENSVKPVEKEEEAESPEVLDADEEVKEKPIKMSKPSLKKKEDKKSTEKAKKEDKPEKKSKKSLTKAEKPKKEDKKAEKKDTVVETNTVSTKGLLPTAKIFPKEIDHEDLGKLVAVPNMYHKYKEVFEAVEAGKTLYFACYWTQRAIKEYDYAGDRMVAAPKKFPNDLDLLVACVPCEKVDRVWCMSQYTEAMFLFEGDCFDPVEDKDPNTGEEFQIRISYGMEFEIYVPADEIV